ncbi:efflux RND transporter periplasmic adaptor subunit [Planctomonas psychrotolerans]|uniref:efflux RND transporter periplasmic adaptor subunit n=1 Tax=Planctomonas psychrotolerans TaxID=2528712 RepID=UPI001D0D658C|nr:efflux RND transporter periplasmic adaptor subunit [Planctomonas psychrotolerans]
MIFAAIAASLVKLAFFGAVNDTTDPTMPTGAVTESHVDATLGTVVNDIVVAGTIEADATVPVRATLAGAVSELLVAQGSAVDAGAPILRIRSETPVDPVIAADGTVTQPKPKVRVETVTAPITGVLGGLAVLKDQLVSVGDTVGSVSPSTFSATGTLSAEQQFRLVSQPEDATVTISGGPAPFTCPGLRVSTGPASGAGTGGDAGAGADPGGDPLAPAPGGGTAVSCSIPAEVRVFNGLAAEITIAAGTAENVLLLPTTAVEGLSDNGNVWLVSDDGAEPTKHPVRIGLNDGVMVQIVDGLAEGETVLEFVPGAPAPVEEPGMMFGSGG